MTETPTYSSWCNMKARCFRKSHKFYKNYGGRGILPCSGISGSFGLFYKILGERPSGTSLDRIDNGGGYTCGECKECLGKDAPLNMRWATRLEQNRNRRPQKNKSGYTGVVKSYNRWIALIRVDGRLRYLGSYSDPLQASKAYQVAKSGAR